MFQSMDTVSQSYKSQPDSAPAVQHETDLHGGIFQLVFRQYPKNQKSMAAGTSNYASLMLILFLALFFSSPSNAQYSTSEEIQLIYIGYLGRGADPEGLAYWTNEVEQGLITVDQIRTNIVNEQPEYHANYGQLSDRDLAEAVYFNLLNREPDQAGLNYWVNQLETGKIAQEDLILAYIKGISSDQDAATLEQKLIDAECYTHHPDIYPQCASEDTSQGNDTSADSDSDSGSNHNHHCKMSPDFVDLSLMTHRATQSGAWSDADTWGGSSPGDGAIVQISEGIEVVVDAMVNARLETVRIDGTLKFATDRNTELQLDTLFSACTGHLQIGTATASIQPDVKARIVFIDDGPVSDAKLLSRGAILMGKTTIHGSPKTHQAIITPQAQQGDSILNLATAPAGWQIDDQLIITGTLPNDPESDEIRNISQIDGNRISLDTPLNLDHSAPKSDLNVYVANASRNVEFISENLEVERRGHIMFMSLDVDVRYARFTELGRTDKTRPLDDFFFAFHDGGDGDDAPATADVTALGGSNVRGRYAIHFHQSGTDPSTTPALVKGSVVFNGPGWGFVNHSSNVDFIDNVSYGLQGAGFYTEAGDEIGSMQGNIAIRSVNHTFEIDHLGAIDPDLSADLMDYGNDGDGFWLTGNRVKMINNVAAGASAHGIIYWTDGIMEPDEFTATRVTVPVKDLANGHLIPDRESVPVWWAALAENRGNESYGSTIGFRIRYIHAKDYLGRKEESEFHRPPPQAYIDTLAPTINDLTVWGNRDGVLLNYNERMNLSGARIVGFGKDMSEFQFNEGTAKTGVGFDIGNEATHGPGRIENVTIEGFGMGFVTPVNGLWEIQDLILRDNETDMLIQDPETSPTQILMQRVEYDSFEVYQEDDDDEDDEEYGDDELPDHISFDS